ncbi:MAG: 30S ribosomal protein S12 methylthiotransferase RimO [Lachnospiraceae bacterium]|nr:30S ribosomal protein S12 methylthiotransferase RimO [Lachnospiraceae bacterium]
MKVLFVSLGCDKNRVDSEKMLGILLKDGYTLTDDEQEADVIVVNTCSFIGDAVEESIDTLIAMGRMKTEGRCRALIACGCLAERYQDDFFAELPEVDAIVGTASWDRISEALERVLADKGEADADPAAEGAEHVRFCGDIDRLPSGTHPRVLTTGGHYAYLKIAEGCGKRCTYCAIPSVRGDYRSVPMEDLLAEASRLADGGVKELILVAQETTLYGTDLYGRKALPELLEKLSAIEDIRWIRLLYCYPEEIDDGLIAAVRDNEKVCNYLDIPIQHINDGILRRMGRRTTGDGIRSLIARLRTEIPGIALRTTLITGFPGEAEEDFEELCDFVREIRFDRLGVFAYSQEEGTAAAVMPDQVDEEVRSARRDSLMEIQQGISLGRGQDFVGQTLEVFVEGEMSEEGTAVGRSYRDAPDVDGYVFFENAGTESGRFERVLITAASEYDLLGVML